MAQRVDGQCPEWIRDAVFYQVFPDRFARSPSVVAPGVLEAWDSPPTTHGFKGGNLPGVVEHLDDLVELGVSAIYLTPVFASPANHRYHTYDYLQVDPLLGGTAALRQLVDSVHQRGMRIIVDGVFNHAGRGFWPFHHVLENGSASPYTDWFHLDLDALRSGRPLRAYPDGADQPPTPAWADAHRAGAQSRRELGYEAWWDLPALPRLNIANPAVRAYLLDVARHWTRFGVDGWRFDVPEEVPLDFWHRMRSVILEENPDAFLVGEVWRVAPEWVGPSGPFDGLMNYPLAWSMIGFAAGAGLDRDVASEQSEMRTHLQPIGGGAFLDSVTAILAAYPESVASAQLTLLGSHDTPRLRTVCGDDSVAVQLAMLLLLTLPGTPCIYYGDEIGMRGRADPDCRGAFPWETGARDEETWRLVRAAIALRAASNALRGDEFVPLAATGDACAFRRGGGDEAAWVIANAGEDEVVLELPDLASDAEPVLGVGGGMVVLRDAGTHVRIAGRSGVVLRRPSPQR